MHNSKGFFACVWFGTMATLMVLWMVFDALKLYGLAFTSGIILTAMFAVMLWVSISIYSGGKNE